MEVSGSTIIAYIAGIATLFVALLFLFIFFPIGLFIAPFGLFYLPPVRRWLNSRFDLGFSQGAVIAIGTAGFILTVMLVFGVLTVGFLASAGGGGEDVVGSDVSDVSVDHAELAGENDDHQLEVTYNTRAQSGVDPDPDSWTSYSPDAGEKFVVASLNVENVGETDIDLTNRLFVLESDGVVYERQGLLGSGHNLDVTLQPGAEYSGWVVFTVPEDLTSATLTGTNDPFYDETATIEFEHDPEMAIGLEE